MNSFLKKLSLLAIIGFLLHLIIIYYTPTLMMKYVGRNWEEQNMINNSFARDLPTSDFTEVIRPSADILYGGCVYDVTYFPLVIETEVPETYWSISFFSENTDNFSTVNENSHNFGKLKMYLFGPGSTPTKVTDGFIVVSPSNKGLMLMRQFVGNGSNVEKLNEIQKNLNCKLQDY